MGLMKQITQGVLGNLSEVSPEQLKKEFGDFLLDNEEISFGFKLVRDAVIFTDTRLIIVDKQGATGKRTRFDSIYLQSIVLVSAETAGPGLDDSEIYITYINSPFLRGHGVGTETKKFEFPKKYDITPVYRLLMGIAIENFDAINA